MITITCDRCKAEMGRQYSPDVRDAHKFTVQFDDFEWHEAK